jgi:chromosome segregation ATPase
VVDSRFNLSREEAEKAVLEAEKIWEEKTQRNLFELTENKGMTINFLYDSRQELTDKLKVLEGEIDGGKEKYNKLKQVYLDLSEKHDSAQEKYKAALDEYNDGKDLYELEVKKWNAKGGAPSDIYEQLKQTELVLREEAVKLESLRVEVNGLVKQVNSTAKKLNELGDKLNRTVNKYNTIGEPVAEEFTEGIFKREGLKSHIEIYQFSERSQLVRVLAHELGHALGLDHVENQNSLMYKQNTEKTSELSKEDLAEFSKVCGGIEKEND